MPPLTNLAFAVGLGNGTYKWPPIVFSKAGLPVLFSVDASGTVVWTELNIGFLVPGG